MPVLVLPPPPVLQIIELPFDVAAVHPSGDGENAFSLLLVHLVNELVDLTLRDTQLLNVFFRPHKQFFMFSIS